MSAWNESNLFFGNQSHDSHVWIDYTLVKKICRKDFACRNVCLLKKVGHHNMFHCYFIVNGNKKLWQREGLHIWYISGHAIPSQLSAHGNITGLRKMQWLVF